MSTAAFSITGSVSGPSPSTDIGFDVVNGETLTLQLEASPGLDIRKAKYEQITKSKGAPDITFPGGGLATPTPLDGVDITAPGSGLHSYKLRCTVNDGKDPATGAPVADWVWERVIAIRGSGVRKMVPDEATEYEQPDGWTGGFNDMVDSIAGGAVLPALGAALTVLAVNAGGSAAEWTSALDVTSITTDTATIGDPLIFDDGTESPATTGRVQLGHDFGGVYARDQADGANAALLQWLGSDQYILGDATVVKDFDLRSLTSIDLEVGGSSVLGCTSSLITAAQPLAIGTGTVSTTGDIRGDSSLHLAARNTGDTADSDLLLWLSDTLYVGHQTNVDDLALYAADGITFKVTGDVAYFVSDEFQLNDGVNLRVGWTNAAGTGDIRMQDTASIKAWATGPVDCNLISKDASDVVAVADAANCSDLTLDSATTVHADIAGTPVLTCTSALISAAQNVQLANNKALLFKDAAAADTNGLKLDASDDLTVGDAANVNNAIYDALTSHSLDIAGTPVLTCTSAEISAAQDVTLADGKKLSLGTTACALGGTLNFPNNKSVAFRNATNSGDLTVLNLNASDTLTVGAFAKSDVVLSGTSWSLRIGGTATLSSTSALITAAQSLTLADSKVLTLGTTNPATGYAINLRNNAGIGIKNGTATATINALYLNASDYLYLGKDGGVDRMYLWADSSIRLYVGSDVLTCTASLITAAQDFQVAAGKDVDCYTNGAYLKPRWVEQATIPTPDTAELLLWSDTTGGVTKLVYNCPTNGVVSTNLT